MEKTTCRGASSLVRFNKYYGDKVMDEMGWMCRAQGRDGEMRMRV